MNSPAKTSIVHRCPGDNNYSYSHSCLAYVYLALFVSVPQKDKPENDNNKSQLHHTCMSAMYSFWLPLNVEKYCDIADKMFSSILHRTEMAILADFWGQFKVLLYYPQYIDIVLDFHISKRVWMWSCWNNTVFEKLLYNQKFSLLEVQKESVEWPIYLSEISLTSLGSWHSMNYFF